MHPLLIKFSRNPSQSVLWCSTNVLNYAPEVLQEGSQGRTTGSRRTASGTRVSISPGIPAPDPKSVSAPESTCAGSVCTRSNVRSSCREMSKAFRSKGCLRARQVDADERAQLALALHLHGDGGDARQDPGWTLRGQRGKLGIGGHHRARELQDGQVRRDLKRTWSFVRKPRTTPCKPLAPLSQTEERTGPAK